MSPAHVLEPTYLATKRRLMQGHWPAGFHLDTARLAEDLDVSTSPVRDSLNRLVGERMVDFEPGAGFQVPRPDEKQLRDLFEFNCYMVIAAVHRLVQPPAFVPAPGSARAAHHFLQLAQATGNGELAGAVSGLNDRLAAVRIVDAKVLRRMTIERHWSERLARGTKRRISWQFSLAIMPGASGTPATTSAFWKWAFSTMPLATRRAADAIGNGRGPHEALECKR